MNYYYCQSRDYASPLHNTISAIGNTDQKTPARVFRLRVADCKSGTPISPQGALALKLVAPALKASVPFLKVCAPFFAASLPVSKMRTAIFAEGAIYLKLGAHDLETVAIFTVPNAPFL